MNLIDFKRKLESMQFEIPKCNYKFMLSIVVFNGRFDYPIKKAYSDTEYNMYLRVFENHLKKRVPIGV
jgi:hypothetical protein